MDFLGMDFETIIWVVVFVLIMLGNARKQAAKAKHEVEDEPSEWGEPWGDKEFDDMRKAMKDFEQQMRGSDSQQGPEAPQFPQKQEYKTRKMEQRKEEMRMPMMDQSHMPSEHPLKRQSAAERRAEVEQLDKRPFYGEVNPYKELDRTKRQHNKIVKPQSMSMKTSDQTSIAELGEHKHTHKVTSTHMEGEKKLMKSHLKPKVEVATDTKSLQQEVEEFDLRRAVIYSEILKPKFEDETL